MMPATKPQLRPSRSRSVERPPDVRFNTRPQRLRYRTDKTYDFGPHPIAREPRPRNPAIRRARSAPASTRVFKASAEEIDQSWANAADNAAELEWAKVRAEISVLAQRSMCAAEAGIRLQAIFRRTPSLLTNELGTVITPDVEGLRGAPRASRELLPLPLPKPKLIKESEIVALFQSDAVLGPKTQRLGAEAWQDLLVSALNGLDSHGNCVSLFGPPSEPQAKALEALLEDCRLFVADTKARTPTDFVKELGAKHQSYWGEPIYCAEDLTLAQVLPTLPGKGVAASVDIVTVLEGQIRDQLRDPESLLLPQEEWPKTVPKAKTMMKDPKEWGSLANELWQRDLTLWLPEELVFHYMGVPIVSGLFGVPKPKDVPGCPGLRQLRLICNLVPSNGFFREIRGDVDHLPYMMQWSSIILKDDEVLLISQEDMTCAFYLFRMPRAWCPYFAVGLPVRLADLEGNSRARDKSKRMAGQASTSGRGYLVLQVLPMGWKSAVGIMQSVHRRILASSLAGSNRLPSPDEIRKTAALPASADQRTQAAWQVYLDNYASFLIARIRRAQELEGKASQWHRSARAAWEAWNIPSAQDKSVANAYTAQELGCYVDGWNGTLGTTAQRRLDAIALSLFILSSPNPHRMWLAITAGRWNFVLQFRRALTCVFQDVWRGIAHWRNCRHLPSSIGRELLTACFLAPACVTHLRARPDLLVTVSDASSTGGAVGATAGLTEYGVQSARALPRQIPERLQTGVALVSLFGGIEAGRRAMDLLGIAVVRHVAVENNKAAIRAVGETYPDVIHYRDVLEFTRGELHNSLAGVRILFVVVTAGFPCQGLSGANATKTGFDDPRSQLFFEGLRVVKEVKDEKHRLEFLFENVASMDNADRDVVSHFLGVRPLMGCASGICQARRKRYLWLSWPVSSGEGVTVKNEKDVWAVAFKAELPSSTLWVQKGWALAGPADVKLPTFMRALPKDKETYLPAGIAATPPDARRRWKAHKYRYPPYQYRKEFCVRHKRNPRLLRVLCAEEREVVMFLGKGATQHALNPVKAKANPQELEDERCSLIGNTFHAGFVALALAPLFVRQRLLETRPSPQDLVGRMGLYPGELFVPGLVCDLTRPAEFHRLDGRRRDVLARSQSAAKAASSSETTPALELAMLTALLRGSDYRGSDVRLDAGELMRPNQWPRRSIDPAKWAWYPLLAHPFHDEEHINILEVRSAFLMLRWRSRSGARIGSRFFHLLDSQVAIAVLAKGRSSAWKLNQVLRRIGALTVAAGFQPSYGYVMSTWNPIDKPSRQWEGGRGPAGATPRRPRSRKRPVRVKKTTSASGEGHLLHGYDVRDTEQACMGILTGIGAERRRVNPGFAERNRKFLRRFDSSLGYPGEGPARPRDRRLRRSELRVIPKPKRGAERVMARRTSASRRRARLGLRLREGLMAPITRVLYAAAFVRLWTWAGQAPPDEVVSPAAYDRLLAAFIEHEWERGATRGDTGNALSASIRMYPSLRGRGQLTDSWYLLNAWSRYELPTRAPPMPPQVLLALAWFFIRSGSMGGAVMLLVGYDCFLRTGEMLSLVLSDLAFAADGTGVVRLGHTKTARRHGAFEASTINDPLCGRLFRVYLRSLPRDFHHDHFLYLPRPNQFYKLFERGIKWLGLEQFGFKPYSVRRGGATSYFRATRNMEATLDRGRWSSTRVARIYVNDGLAREVELRFAPDIRHRLRILVAALQHWLAEQ